ncbi:MAG TPA: hypothetical protein VGP46_03660, partial [Acidimicrobiales bacterium]|nr:hypothetical protein [Acidimicrobiales bacterium]
MATGKRPHRLQVLALGATVVAGVALSACGPSSKAASWPKANPDVLLVGTYEGDRGTYTTIQEAVDHAKPGNWILIAPGDYHEDDDHIHPPTAAQADVGDMAGVLITTPNIHLRGMSRSSVIVDGTKAGAPKACDSSPA